MIARWLVLRDVPFRLPAGSPCWAQQNVRVPVEQGGRTVQLAAQLYQARRRRPAGARRRDLPWLRRAGPEHRAHGRASGVVGLCRADRRQFFRARPEGRVRPQLADAGAGRGARARHRCRARLARRAELRRSQAARRHGLFLRRRRRHAARALRHARRSARRRPRARRSWSIPIARWPMRWARSSPCASRPCSPWARSTTGRRPRNAAP